MATALYPGSFDPVTDGHVHVVERGLALFDELIVAVAVNRMKQPTFTVEERVALLQTVLPDDDRLRVLAIEGLVADFCRAHEVQVLLRGARTTADLVVERQLARMNALQGEGVETMVVPATRLAHVSSSLVRAVAGCGGPVDGVVPPAVAAGLRRGPVET